MDPFITYLLAVNAIAFLAFALDYVLTAKFPRLDNSLVNSLVMDVFPLAGGAIGMLLALFLLGGRNRGHRMNKDNIAWWFIAIVCLIVWALVVAVKFNFVNLDASAAGILAGWNVGALKILGIYLAIINVVAFIVFAWDKHVAATGNDHRKRTPEAYLLGLCLIGGSVGGLLAVHLLRHKTRKWYFTWGPLAFIVLHVVILLYVHLVGLI